MTAIKTTATTCRPRPHSGSRSVDIAKKDFATRVSKCIGELIKDYGYSRERATTLLARAFADNNDGSQPKYPSDNEIFDLMKVHKLGIDDASRALVVSNAIQKATVQRGLSPVQAIDYLCSQLEIDKLLELEDRLSSLSVMDCCPTTTRPPATTPVTKTAKSKVGAVSSTSTTAISHRVSSTVLRKAKTINKSPKTQTRKRTNHNTASSSNAMTSLLTNSNKSSKNNELQQPQVAVVGNINNKRPRADSITPEIEAKIAAKKAKTSSGVGGNNNNAANEEPSSKPPSVAVTSSGSMRNTKQRAMVPSGTTNNTTPSSHASSKNPSSTTAATGNP